MNRDRHAPHFSGFTLIELLIVIAIIAVLAVVVILALNPADLLRQARDSNRLSDLSTLNAAITQYSADLAGSPNVPLGTPFVTYLSIPDPTATTTAGTDCSGLGFPSGTALHCPASSTYRNVDGTGWIPIDFTTMTNRVLAVLPVDPVNQTSSDLYYAYVTDGKDFKIMAMPESEKFVDEAGKNPNLFAAGTNLALDGGSWVVVPGNPIFGTSNFYVMKYEADCSDGEGNYLNDFNNGTNDYGNYLEPCTRTNNRQIASLPGGWPITSIDEGTAAQYCTSVGAHLITNNEWQTIAWNAEDVASNWSEGSVGLGAIYLGHSEGYGTSPASDDDTQGYFGTDGPASGGGIGSNITQRRTLTLSNGSVIWDMAGNVAEFTSDTITGSNEPHGTATGWNWYQFTDITTWGSISQQTAGPANSDWNSSQGIGEIYSDNAINGTTYDIIRGGLWGLGSKVGVEYLELDDISGNDNGGGIGFRCVR